MDDDVIIKALLGFYLTIMYVVVFITQPVDIATTVSLISGFTNALIGIFAYNIHKRRVKKAKENRE